MAGSPPPKTHATPGWRIGLLPTTALGWWAVGLAAASVAGVMWWSALGRFGGIPGLALGLAGGFVGVEAVLRRGERAIAVFVAVVPALTGALFLVLELLVGHD